jgi:2,3,4,5-tetrahydropyridine-2-carboxylate N-succinyltransferase
MTLQQQIERWYATPPRSSEEQEALKCFDEFKALLNEGRVRSAEPTNDGGWVVNDWVKKGILLGFKLGKLADVSVNDQFRYFDKHTYPLRKLTLENEVRIVPGGSSVRDGAFVARNVVIMPPAYVNVGAYVDEGTMVDSHALVGSCAQVGKRVHLSAASQIGGVLEPIGALPVIVEDQVFIGGNCGIYEGTVVKRRAVIGAGVLLTASMPVYDLVKGAIYRRTPDAPLTIPEGAVVVQGSRHVDQPFARQHQIAIYTPVIIKYRNEDTDAATVLEESLR